MEPNPWGPVRLKPVENEPDLRAENARLRREIHDLKSEVRRLKVILAELGAES